MQIECPVLKRCCCCLPLRYGLIVWGYLKLFISSILFISLCFALEFVVRMCSTDVETREIMAIVILCITVSVTLADIALSLTFIIGCHKKKVKLIKAYYSYSIFLVALTILLPIYSIVQTIIFVCTDGYVYFTLSFCIYELLDTLILVAYVIIQIYILLLVRSEMIKLNNGCQFRFVNNAANAECILNIKNETMNEEPEKNYREVENNDEMRIYV